MKFVQASLDRLLSSMRDGYLSRPPAAGRRFAPLGFAPMVVPVRWDRGRPGGLGASRH